MVKKTKSFAHNNNCKRNNLLKKERMKNEKRKKNWTTQIGTNVRARGFNAGLLAISQFASGRPTRSRFSLVPEQMLGWYPNSTCTACFPCSPPNGNIKNLALH
jgi:hypothetical protein